ncbi:amidase [Beijerinckia sp. L45]|uniref:amidase n=1 Tax=Beijerinckia sp. L45 TaxID=1641855 RepID=UPI00131DE640|nr:amidase [Beijerinckia sp. L45]
MNQENHSTPKRRPFLAASAAFASGTETPRTFLEGCLEDVARWEPSVGAFTVMDLEGARRNADESTKRWAEGKPLSAIDGMPVGIKDIIDTDDMDTQQGSVLYQGHRPLFGAASAIALRLAGSTILGKTVTTEFASSEPRGTRNPWDVTRTPGGSSSGSAAAVGAGMVSGAMGTQVVGSIIRPAAFCGTYGYKPSVGGINRGGSLDLLSHSCSGVIAASLEDAWVMAREIVARVGGDPGHVGIVGPMTPPAAERPKRLGLLQTAGWAVIEPEAQEALERAIADLRQSGIEVVTRTDWAALEETEQALAESLDIAMKIIAWEWRWPLNAFMARDASAISQSARDRAATAEAMTQAEYAAILTRRAAIRATYAKLADGVDALISVTAPGAAPVGLATTGNPIFVVPGSILGVPVVTLPRLQAGGMPLGLQILGFEGGDAKLFALAAGLDQM